MAQDILGHADIRTTERYTHTLVEDQAAVQRKSQKIEKRKKQNELD